MLLWISSKNTNNNNSELYNKHFIQILNILEYIIV